MDSYRKHHQKLMDVIFSPTQVDSECNFRNQIMGNKRRDFLYSSMYEPLNKNLTGKNKPDRARKIQRDIRCYTRNTLREQAQTHYTLCMSPDLSTMYQSYFACSPKIDYAFSPQQSLIVTKTGNRKRNKNFKKIHSSIDSYNDRDDSLPILKSKACIKIKNPLRLSSITKTKNNKIKNLMCKINQKSSIIPSQAEKRKIVTDMVKRLFQPCKGIIEKNSKQIEPVKAKASPSNKAKSKCQFKGRYLISDSLFSPIRLKKKNISILACNNEPLVNKEESNQEKEQNCLQVNPKKRRSIINKKSNTTIYNVSTKIPSSKLEQVIKNKTMRSNYQLQVFKRSSTKNVDNQLRKSCENPSETVVNSGLTLSKTKTKQYTSNNKDTSISKSSNSECNTTEFFGISTNKESMNILAKNKDNSYHTSLSKSSESRGAASNNSASKFNNSATCSNIHRSYNSKESITRELSRPQINFDCDTTKLEKVKVISKENIPCEFSSSRLNTIFDKQEGFADIAMKESNKIDAQKIRIFNPKSYIVECKLNAIPTFVPKNKEQDQEDCDNFNSYYKKNSDISIATDLRTESLNYFTQEKDCDHILSARENLKDDVFEEIKEEVKEEIREGDHEEKIQEEKQEKVNGERQEEEQKETKEINYSLICLKEYSPTKITENESNRLAVPCSIIEKDSEDQANNGNKRYKSQFYLHSKNETLEDNIPASPSKMTEQPYLFINLDEDNFEVDSVSNSEKEGNTMSIKSSLIAILDSNTKEFLNSQHPHILTSKESSERKLSAEYLLPTVIVEHMDSKKEKESQKVINQGMLNFENDIQLKDKIKSTKSLKNKNSTQSEVNCNGNEEKKESGENVSVPDQEKISISRVILNAKNIRSGLSVMDLDKGEQLSACSPGNQKQIVSGFGLLDCKYVSQSTANFNFQKYSDSSSKKVSSVVSFSPKNQFYNTEMSLGQMNIDELEMPLSFLIPFEVSVLEWYDEILFE